MDHSEAGDSEIVDEVDSRQPGVRSSPRLAGVVGVAGLLLLALLSIQLLSTSDESDEVQPSATGDHAKVETPTSLAFLEPPAAEDAAETPAATVVVAEAKGASVVAYDQPSADGDAVVTLDNPTPRGGPLVLQAAQPDPDPRDEWLEVYLPVRPNGTTGWVQTSELSLSINPFRIEVDAGRHLLRVYENDRLYLSSTVGIGTGETPTPIGSFYIIELLQPASGDGPYGPYAFGLSGFSESLDDFAGGQGVIGIHGTNDPDSLGRDASHGCIRVANRTIEELAQVLPLGTPVHISN